MKLSDIISENVDVSFWKELDKGYNPEAFAYVEKQEKQHAELHQKSGTPIITKSNDKQTPFTNKPHQDGPKSAGYRGNVDAQVKTGHISKKEGDKLVS